MSVERLRVVVIIGSIRRGRFGPTAAGWFAAHASERDDVEVDVVDLAEAWLPEVLPDVRARLPTPQPVRDLAPWLAAADAFVVVTPEYNHGFPGALKNAIDWFREEWRAKPVAFVCYGGPAGGLRAVEQLRLVFTAVGAVPIRETVSLRDHRDRFDSAGRPLDRGTTNAAATALLGQLTWWAALLRDNRAGPPPDTRCDVPPDNHPLPRGPHR
ncbi:NADPH-dependent FMN reductase [Pseudonocardia humida]|uniref:NAD(P)H-dependent oxidoreductase n=1 Tax=Pseudonocardia humida TaxID=2800819 RepID=A0ABT1A7S2_9PSEU|nr:NAD(P)H-dependent oxidoreductase [Pseudonocardia humida]MCO1659067.1 NAD(P)H-dependent oxidoreductase [Pseudonocardia humida]